MSDKMNHTPGPWVVEAGNLTAKGGRCILAWLHTWDLDAPEEAAANARLIAAAPELLEFVAEYMDIYEAASSARTDDLVQHIVAQQERMTVLYLRARSLHAKATGGNDAP